MSDLKKIGLICSIGVPIILFLVLFLVLTSSQSASGNDSIVIVSNYDFKVPFKNNDVYSVTGLYGNRLDPFGSGTTVFHSGIDLGAKEGTDIVASADGVIYEVGYNESGLGNYVYIKHNTNDGIIYTAYGHMLDDSIVVEKGQKVKQGDKLGEVGTTGLSTGNHLHFMIMKDKISFNKDDLIDPYYVIYGLN